MSLRDPNRKPTHPGAVLREDVLPAIGMTQTELAARLGVGRLTVNEVLNEKRALSADMASRIERLLGASAESWLQMQATYDLWHVRRSKAAQLAAVKPLPRADWPTLVTA